jgi:hypothetical protein
MSHISTYNLTPQLGARLATQSLISNLKLQGQNRRNLQQEEFAKNRRNAEQLVLSELRRNFVELTSRQEDPVGNLRLLLRVNSRAVPGKTGEVEVLINSDNTLSIDVSNAPGSACKELTESLELALGNPISVHYKPEYHDGRVRLNDGQRGIS